MPTRQLPCSAGSSLASTCQGRHLLHTKSVVRREIVEAIVIDGASVAREAAILLQDLRRRHAGVPWAVRPTCDGRACCGVGLFPISTSPWRRNCQLLLFRDHVANHLEGPLGKCAHGARLHHRSIVESSRVAHASASEIPSRLVRTRCHVSCTGCRHDSGKGTVEGTMPARLVLSFPTRQCVQRRDAARRARKLDRHHPSRQLCLHDSRCRVRLALSWRCRRLTMSGMTLSDARQVWCPNSMRRVCT